MMYACTSCGTIRANHTTPLFVSGKKGFVLIGETCTVLLGVEGVPFKTFLIVPQDTDIEAMIPMMQKMLPPMDHDTTKSLRVCALVHGTQKCRDVAIINASGASIVDVTTVNITKSVVKDSTEQLCHDFWKDAWYNNAWESHNHRTIAHQGAMHGRL